MNKHDKRIIHSSVESKWRTPDDLFSALDREFDFVLDAAARSVDAKCANYLGPDHENKALRDALVVDWYAHVVSLAYHGRARLAAKLSIGSVFDNPPYSRKGYRESVEAGKPNRALLIEEWVEKCAREAARGLTVVGVIPAATQTRWWHEFIRSGPLKASEIRTLPHRVTFERPAGSKETETNNAGGNTAIVIWRPDPGYLGDWQPAERVWTYRTPKPVKAKRPRKTA